MNDYETEVIVTGHMISSLLRGEKVTVNVEKTHKVTLIPMEI